MKEYFIEVSQYNPVMYLASVSGEDGKWTQNLASALDKEVVEKFISEHKEKVEAWNSPERALFFDKTHLWLLDYVKSNPKPPQYLHPESDEQINWHNKFTPTFNVYRENLALKMGLDLKCFFDDEPLEYKITEIPFFQEMDSFGL